MLFVPLGLYMLFLASMHLNDRPTLVRATYDFWCLLWGLAGVLFLGIPGSLTRLYEVLHLRSLASIGTRSIIDEPVFWTGVFGFYFVAVVGLVVIVAAAAAYRRRRGMRRWLGRWRRGHFTAARARRLGNAAQQEINISQRPLKNKCKVSGDFLECSQRYSGTRALSPAL